VFRIDGAAVSIDGLNIRGGRLVGSENGAGILNQGTLQLTHCAISDNRTEASGNGGGIWNSGILEISDCEINANEAGRGGAIYSNGTLTVVRSLLQNNFATSGGGIFAGEIQPVGAMVISNSTIRKNLATDFGAGLYVQVQKARIESTTINDNVAREQGAGIYFTSAETRRALQLINSTVSGNLAGVRGGGIASDASGFGGTELEITGCTIVFNSAGAGGGVDSNASAQAYSNAEFRSSIIFKNSGGNLQASSGLGAMQSQGFNLTDDKIQGYLSQSSDLLGSDPLISSLANNGGRNQTHALLPGSPALDQGYSFGASNDQRGLGFARIIDSELIANAIGGDGADIGAFEFQRVK
jgi:predicted outer membrane repeat protein